MAFNTSQSELSKLDKEIRLLEDRLTHLRSTRNALIPIGHLPLEVLERIFNIARSEGVYTIHLSWVSHAWRTLALGSKALWTLITDFNLRWTSIYLERSFPTPLLINLERPLDKEDISSRIVEQLLRIKALILPRDSISYTMVRLIQDALSKHGPSPLPHLKLIRLARSQVTEYMLICLQNVHHLSLRWCEVNWSVRSTFPSLRSLSISLPVRTVIPLHTLLDCLQNMPALKFLVLEHFFVSISESVQSNTGTRRSFDNGPKLTTLGIVEYDVPREVVSFVQVAGCITQDTNVSIRLDLHREPLEEIREILVLLDDWATGREQGVTHLGIDCSDDTNKETDNINLRYGSTEVVSGQERGCVHLHITIPLRIRNGYPLIPVLSQSLSLRNLNVLWINLYLKKDPDTASWQRFVDAFGRLPQLQHFALSTRCGRRPADHLLDMISIHYAPMFNTQALDQLPFPALKSFLFPYRSPSKEAMYAFLQWRQSQGLKLETLGLAEECEITTLRDFVGENMDEFADEVIYAGQYGYFAEEERYQFLQRAKEILNIPLDISSMIMDS